jgi:hypothetical protein
MLVTPFSRGCFALWRAAEPFPDHVNP